MDFITRILGKLFLSTMCLGQLFNRGGHAGEIKSPPYIKYVHEVKAKFIKDMQKFGFHCDGSGGEMPNDVCGLTLMFSIIQKGSIEEGRKKIIFLSEKYLEAINADERLQPYLREYPFPESRLSISLAFTKSDHLPYTDGSVAHVHHVKSKIIYSVDADVRFETIEEEPYKVALTKVLGYKIPSTSEPLLKVSQKTSADKEVEKHPAPSLRKKRLGTLVTDLKGFTPGRELEALGIQNPAGQPEFASDLGELIGGICDEYFGEAFLEELAIWAIEHPNEEYIDYWDNGQVKVKIFYKNGWAEGHVHGWYESGNTAFKAYYKNGKRVGIQLASFLTGCSDPLGRIFCYDMQGRLDGRQETCSYGGLRLLSIVYFKHGVLHGETGFYAGKRGGGCYGEWDYKDGKIKKIIKPPVSPSQ